MALQAQLFFFFFTIAMRSRDRKLFSVSMSALIRSAGNDTTSALAWEQAETNADTDQGAEGMRQRENRIRE